MIFAQLQYDDSYSDVHAELAAFLGAHFEDTKSGLQGDSWIWIREGEEKVEVDTFSSMQHQVKSATHGELVQRVIEVLMLKYDVQLHAAPELDAHE